MWQTKEEKIQLLKELVAIPSISRTEGEKQVPLFLHQKCTDLPYFKENTNFLNIGDLYFSAFVKGNTEKTIVLISHYDVVGIDDYGENSKIAFDVDKITDYFKENPTIDEEGEWLFGRGTMDMKAGLVVELGLIEKASLGEFDGSLLLIAVGDEEVGSKGMMNATKEIERIKKEHDLSIVLCLNTEPSFKEQPFDTNKYIYSGTIGKLLPSFYFKGQETHVGEPFAGLNASFMCSILTNELELSADFQEVIDGEVTQPLSNLLMRDLKPFYNVQTPTSAFSYFNLFYMEQSIVDITEKLLNKTKEIARKIIKVYEEKATNANAEHLPFDIKVVLFEELYKEVVSIHGKEKIEKEIALFLYKTDRQDEREISLGVVELLVSFLEDKIPMIVLFYSPPFYPAVSSRNHPMINSAIEFVQEYAIYNYQTNIEKRSFFQGLCDLSYVSSPKGIITPLTLNMPSFNKGYDIPFDVIENFDFPVLNLGTYGCDPHQRTERLEVNYSFETLPDILEKTINFYFEQTNKDL